MVMGILNVIPDSFFDGGQLASAQAITDRAGQMLAEGAAILDIGGHSSRPGADDVSVDEELERVLRGIEAAKAANAEVVISVDTFRSTVAKQAVEAGASIVNDISGGDLDDAMFATVAALKVPYILMHMQGKPANMQQAPQYENVVREVFQSLQQRIQQCVIVLHRFAKAKARIRKVKISKTIFIPMEKLSESVVS